MDLDLLLQEVTERGGSDLHLKVGRPPLFRITGDLLPSNHPEIQRAEMQQAIFHIMGPAVQKRFERDLEADFSYEIPGLGRFRVNAFVQRGEVGAVFRYIPLEVPSIEVLGLPQVFRDISSYPNGLVCVTGPTGCGKSTSLAAMIQHLNQTRPVHVITVEDPIEFVYTDETATINQRELMIDTLDVKTALRSALRQDPDVILIGEMRDLDTMAFAITAAETGHLVMGTLHTNNATQTIDRILDAFPADHQNQVRLQLALTLRAVVSQRLCKRADGTGLVAVVEILINSPSVQQILHEGAVRDLGKAIESDTYYGMQSFNQHLLKLVQSGIITEEEALRNSMAPDDLKLGLRGITKGTLKGGGAESPAAGALGGTEPPRRRTFE